ncbi:MAG: MBOAT family protein, partial [Candidatus Omnitrophica bacterium]|nr:MBOAT family protein [Candidatus Omnitrophota bacterium]
MLFNSLTFVYFFLIVYGLYAVSKHRWQNTILLVGSYVFYGWWDWRFLSLIVFSTFLDYVCGIRIEEHADPKIKKRYLAISMIGNLGVLGFFKYYNFFTESLRLMLDGWGVTLSMPTMHVILPLGISFYTFQTLSYTIDIYYGRLKPTRHFWDFALFVTFFPQLVAGPIERAIHLLPQILQPRQITMAKFKDGCQLVLW